MNPKSLFKKISFLLKKELIEKLNLHTRNFFNSKSKLVRAISGLLLFFWLLFVWFIDSIKWYKKDLAKHYGICKETLNNWVENYCPNIDLERWKKTRKIDAYDLCAFFNTLGYPERSESFTKARMAEILGTCTRILKESIYEYPEKYGVSKKAYSSMTVFPPKIGRAIIAGWE